MNRLLPLDGFTIDHARAKSAPYFGLVALIVFTCTLICWQLLNSLSLGFACGLSIGLLVAPFVLYKWQRTPVAPVYLTVLFLLIAYPIKFIAVRMAVPGVIEEYQGRLYDDDAVFLAMMILSAGILAYHLGYYKTPKFLIRRIERARLPIRTFITPQWYWLALVVALIGWGTFVFQMFAETWSSFASLGASWDPKYNQVLSYLFNYVWCGVIAAAVWLSYKNLKRSWIGIAICATIILSTFVAVLFLMGSKTWLLSPFLYLFGAIYMNNRRAPIWIVGAITLAAVLFAFTFVPLYRRIYLSTNEGRAGTVTELYRTGNETFSRLDGSTLETSESFASIINRFGGIDNAVRIMEMAPEPLGYFYFKDLATMPFSFVPRLIFPWKLDPETPSVYTTEVALMQSGGSAAPFPVAEGYINLGWLGVVLLFWIWGVAQSLLFNGFFLPRRTDALVQILYAFFVLQIVGFGNWITGALLGAPGQLITLIPLIIIFRSLSGRWYRVRSLSIGNQTQPRELSQSLVQAPLK